MTEKLPTHRPGACPLCDDFRNSLRPTFQTEPGRPRPVSSFATPARIAEMTAAARQQLQNQGVEGTITVRTGTQPVEPPRPLLTDEQLRAASRSLYEAVRQPSFFRRFITTSGT
jgi:hypothetical protein